MSAASEPSGTLEIAMERALCLLDADPALAEEQALEILNAVPNHPPAVLLQATARRRSGDPVAALEVLEPLVHVQKVWAAAHFELGLALACVGRGDEANQALQRTVDLTRAKHLKTHFSRGFFGQRTGSGCDAPDPIFIVGMPRSCSTRLEQILSSHSAVEETTELPEIISMAKDLSEQADTEDIAAYAGVLATKNATQLRELGEQFGGKLVDMLTRRVRN